MKKIGVETLVHLVLEELRSQGYSDTSLHVEKKALRCVLRLHETEGQKLFNPMLLEEQVRNFDARFKQGA